MLLGRWSYDDLLCIEEASRDPVIPTGTTVPNPFSEEAGRAFVERQWGRFASGEGLVLAMAEAATGTATGMMCLLHRQQSGVVGVGYFTVASCRRRGSTGTSLSLLSRWALSLPGIVRLEALIQLENEGSIRVVESVGFRREGLLRKYLDPGHHSRGRIPLLTDRRGRRRTRAGSPRAPQTLPDAELAPHVSWRESCLTDQ